MGHKVFTPCRFNRRFEGQHEDALEAHLLCKLIGGKGFPETHLCIPEKFRRSAGVLFRSISIILHRALNRLILFRTHFEGGRTAGVSDNASFQFNDGSFDICHSAVKPFVAVVALIHLTKSLAAEDAVDILIRKDRAIGAHSGFRVQDIRLQTAGVHLLVDAGFCITVSIADFHIAFVGGDLRKVIDINRRCYSRTLYEELLISHPVHHRSPSALSWHQ